MISLRIYRFICSFFLCIYRFVYDSRFMYESIYIFFFLNCILYNEKLKTCAYITGHAEKKEEEK